MMHIPFFSKLFSKKTKTLQSYNSLIIKQLRLFAKEHNYPLFENIPIYHRSQTITPKLVMFIPEYGLILFEYKDWDYNELKDATVTLEEKDTKNKEKLSFSPLREFIEEKFNDITQKEELSIYNFIIFEDLTKKEFSLLDESFHKLIPQDRVLFSDNTKEDLQILFEKLPKTPSQSVLNILPYIYSQFLLYDGKEHLFANKEQREFITSKQPQLTLQGSRRSGKTLSLVQKMFQTKLQHPKNAIYFITPFEEKIASLEKNLLYVVELSGITVDMSEIHFVTPLEYLNQLRLKNNLLPNDSFLIDEKLQKKHTPIADTIFCDDTHLLDDFFIDFLIEQKKKNLYCVNLLKPIETFPLRQEYNAPFEIIQANDARYLHILYTLLEKDRDNIFIFYQNATAEALQEEIKGFCGIDAVVVDKETPNKEQIKVALVQYDPYFSYYPNYAIFLETKTIPSHLEKHYGTLAQEKNYFLKGNI